MSDEIQRVVIVDGGRTPFVKAGTNFRDFGFRDLARDLLLGLITRGSYEPARFDEMIFSTVLLDPRTPNWAREIWFSAGLPPSVFCYSMSNNCVSGLMAITAGADRIRVGQAHAIIAGGSESMSNPSLVFGEAGSKLFLSLGRARTAGERLRLFMKFRPGMFLPRAPGVTEPSTGLSMGEHMEITAKELGISRKEQDELALMSHQRAAAATADGHHREDIIPLAGVDRDLLVRSDTTLEKLAKLRPVFDRSDKGTLTAGNSSALTDGASAVVLMSERRAAEEGRDVLAFVRGYEYAAISPSDGLLMAPAIAVPRLLRRLGLSLHDFDLFEVHEAFAAQVAANLKAWRDGWREGAIGEIPRERLNVLGGSIALGHPFAATGGRMVTALARELKRRGARRGLISICAAGAMAGALVLERP